MDEGSHLIIVDDPQVPGLVISGIEAALWRWLHQSFTRLEILDLYSALTNIPITEGEIQIKEIIHHWEKLGLLEVIHD